MESSVLRVGKISDEIFIYMYGKDKESIKKKKVKEKGTSLVVQWLGICLAMQETWSGKIPHNTEELSPVRHHYRA